MRNRSTSQPRSSLRLFPQGAFLSLVGALASAAVLAQSNFGDAPLCEASSALILPCPGSAGQCLYVGDNEQEKALFFLPLTGDMVQLTDQRTLPLSLQHATKPGIDEISDIEALAQGPNDSLLIFGSHSRNSQCEAKKKRRRIASVDLGTGGAAQGTVKDKKRLTCDNLFVATARSDSIVKAACNLITRTEKAADDIEKALDEKRLTKAHARDQCNSLAPFNAEGAVTVPGSGGTDIWVGLRSPLLDQHPDPTVQPVASALAMLLHMPDSSTYQFDRVALLDMDGRGVRDLAHADGWVWVIAGPPEDGTDCFQLARFPSSDLSGNQLIRPDLFGCLPTSSEGLAVLGGKAFVVIDGDEGEVDSTGVCGTPSGFMALSLPM